MKVKKRRRISLFSLLIIALLIVGIGYASINSVILEMAGTVRAEVPKNVFITNVEYVSDVDANTTNSKIKNYLGTMMQSTVELSKTNPNSEIIYKVTVYNNSTKTGTFLDVIYDQANYDNQDIVYEIQDTGFKIDDTIAPKEKKDILIKFKYKDSTLATNNVLNSYLNFKIAEPNMLKQISSSAYFFGAVEKSKIEKISFELGTIPENYTQSFDASANQDKSIMGYVTDTDSNNMYEITFSSDAPIFANTDSSFLFYYLTKLTNISFNNFRTTTATNMSSMFSYCNSLTSLDLNNFNTSQVTNMSNMFQSCNALTSLGVSNFNTSQVTNMEAMFYCCRSLTSIDVSNFNTSQVTNMGGMFYSCKSLATLDLNNFNTSQVTNMSNMFQSCNALTSLGVSNFNTSQVTNMEAMFYCCRSLTSIDVSSFDTSNVTSMVYMFAVCESLTNLELTNFNTSKVVNMSNMFDTCQELVNLDLRSFDTNNVSDMSSMFYCCSNLISLDISSFDTSNVTDMSSMFFCCRTLTSLNLSSFDTSNVTNMSDMFNLCESLPSLDLSNFDTNNVTDMSSIFSNCRTLTSLNLSSFGTSKVINMSYMFYGCESLPSLDISSFDTSNVTNMSQMFYNCEKLTTIYAKYKFNTDKVTSSSNMFVTCSALVGGNGTVYNSSYTDKTYARIDKIGTPGYFTKKKEDVFLKKEMTSPTTFFGVCNRFDITKIVIQGSTSGAPSTFTDISEAEDGSIISWLDGTTLYIASQDNIFTNVDSSYLFSGMSYVETIEGLELVNTSKTTNMSYMFEECSGSSNLSSFDTSNVTDMSGMFKSCMFLRTLDLSNFNTSNVTNMSGMFGTCKSLATLDLSNFNTSNVTNMSGMFEWCRGLTSLDLTNFNTSNVTNMSYMFNSCSKLTTIYASDEFITDKVTDSTDMFEGCTSSLKGGNGTYFNSNYTDKTYARIDKSGTPGYFTKLVTYNAPAIIPNGFVASQATGEKDVSTGLVIYEGTTPVTDSNVETAKKTRNQFVWIPVDDISDFVRVDGYKNGSKQSLVSSCSEPYTNATAEEISEYNAMIASVEKYHGFYIARYEASKSSSGKAQSMSNQSPWVKMRWGGSMRVSSSSDAVEVSRAVYNSASAEKDPVSTLVYGVQWDQTVRFLKQNYSDIETDSKNYGNYKNSKLTFINSSGNSVTKASGSVAVVPTGNTEHSKTNNIYDMAGNIEEWTMEAYSTTCRVTRGGNWSYNGTTVYSISSRNTWTPTDKTAGSDLRL